MQKTITYQDFQDDEAIEATTLVDYYEGEQLEYVEKMLDGKFDGYGKREEWRERGYVPRSRNITKSIVDKSGLLFNKPPKMFILPPNGGRAISDPTFDKLMHESDYLEFFQNVDAYTRLLKSIVVLQQKYIPTAIQTINGKYQYNPQRGDALLLTLLHRGNCVVRMDITNTRINELAFLIETPDTDDDEDDVWAYRVITPTEIADFIVKGEDEAMIPGSLHPNEDGFVPANFFYDVNKPRCGAWNEIPEDLKSFQELYNLHLTDLEFANAWQKQKTLFVDSPIIEADNSSMNASFLPAGHTDGGTMYAPQQTKKSLGGLGRIVTLAPGMNDKDPMVKFDGPTTDLAALDEMIRKLITDLAQDWDVNLNTVGQPKASSGFQIVVEEMNNLNLREKRGQSFRAGLRRFYNITQRLYPELPEGTLFADFAQPSIPVNTQEQEVMWQMRLDGGRATLVDYFMETQEMTEQEALDKIKEIIAEKKLLAAEVPSLVKSVDPTQATNIATQGPTSPSSTTG